MPPSRKFLNQKVPHMLKKIISGAQTGADVAGLDAAKDFGVETGGLMPFGYKTLDGCKPQYQEIYGISAHHSSSYVPRTRRNVKDSDGTARFAFNWNSSGEKCTFKAIVDFDRPYFDVDLNNPPDVQKFIEWLDEHNIEVLNVAGNSERTAPGTYEATKKYLTQAMDAMGLTMQGSIDEKIGNHEGSSLDG